MEKIHTVLGSISKDDLGITLTHEHLLIDIRPFCRTPTDPSKRYLVNAPITLQNLGELHRDVHISKINYLLDDVSLAINEINKFKSAGGRSLVEMTLPSMGRNPSGLQTISKETGVNIIMAVGWYTSPHNHKFVRDKEVNELTNSIIEGLTEGIDNTDVKAGIIKAACSHPIQDSEKKVLLAVAQAQEETNAPLTIHPPLRDVEKRRIVKTGEKVLTILIKGGADPNKIFLSHMDLTCSDYRITQLSLDYHRFLMDEYGITLNYDTFGNDTFFDSFYLGCTKPCDRLRTAAVVDLCKEGFEKQIMLSHDTAMKLSLTHYGGFGYAHILKHIIPALRLEGVSEKQINTMLIENPKSILSW